MAIPRPSKNPSEILQQVQEAADKMADLVQRGAQLKGSYVFDEGLHHSGFYR
jgi:hypothetical protein